MIRERQSLQSWIDLRARLWLVMVFVLLPALGYIVVSSMLERDRARAQAQAELLAEARLAGTAEQQSLDELGRTLALAAALPAVREAAQASSPAACQASLAQLTGLYPQTLGFNLWNLKGDPICAGQPVPFGFNLIGSTTNTACRCLASSENAVIIERQPTSRQQGQQQQQQPPPQEQNTTPQQEPPYEGQD